MAKEREVRKETGFWGNEKEVIYEDGHRVGELRTEERGGFFGLGAEQVKVEYDTRGTEQATYRQEERGGFLGLGSEPVEVRYDSNNRETGYSKVEERGGFLGIGSHHVRVEYDTQGREVSQTAHENRGGFLGLGAESVRVTKYNPPSTIHRSRGISGGFGGAAASGGGTASSESHLGIGTVALIIVCGFLVLLLIFAGDARHQSTQTPHPTLPDTGRSYLPPAPNSDCIAFAGNPCR
jgi:hypothetical protein